MHQMYLNALDPMNENPSADGAVSFGLLDPAPGMT
jgi:hypothetical protein